MFTPHKVAGLTIVVELDPARGGGLLEPLPLVTITHGVAAKVGYDIAGKELEGFSQLLGPGPLMSRQHKPAEASCFSLYSLDLRNRIVRRANDPVPPVGARARRDFVRRLARISLIGCLQSNGKEIFHVAPNARFNIGPGF